MRTARLLLLCLLAAAASVPAAANDANCGGIAPVDTRCTRRSTARTTNPQASTSVGPEFLGTVTAEVRSTTGIRRASCTYGVTSTLCVGVFGGTFSVGQRLTLTGSVSGSPVPPVGRWTARLID